MKFACRPEYDADKQYKWPPRLDAFGKSSRDHRFAFFAAAINTTRAVGIASKQKKTEQSTETKRNEDRVKS